MERKTKEKKAEYTNFSVRLPVKLIEEIESMALKENRTRNNMIEQMLRYAAGLMHDTHDTSLA